MLFYKVLSLSCQYFLWKSVVRTSSSDFLISTVKVININLQILIAKKMDVLLYSVKKCTVVCKRFLNITYFFLHLHFYIIDSLTSVPLHLQANFC